MGKKSQDLTGRPFGRWTAIRQDGCDSHGNAYWVCRCKCGNERRVLACNLLRERTLSCGCLSREQFVSRNTTHGCAQETWYDTYNGMMHRCGHCEGGKESDLRKYRDRGITVCELWRSSPRAFGDWLIAHGWRKGLQIDRIDNNQGYSPENCRVVSPKENTNNRRSTSRLDDGTSLAMFCTSIGINTYEGGKVTREYARIQRMWSQAHKPHPELMQALKDDTDKQSRLLETTKLKIRHAELMISAYKELLASKQTA